MNFVEEEPFALQTLGRDMDQPAKGRLGGGSISLKEGENIFSEAHRLNYTKSPEGLPEKQGRVTKAFGTVEHLVNRQ